MLNAAHTSKPVQQKNNLPASSLFFQPKPTGTAFFNAAPPIVQRQKAGEKEDKKPADDKDHLVLTLPEMDKMDYLGVNEALHYRGVLVPSAYSDDATTEWLRQHKFYKSFHAGNIAEKVLKAPVLRLLDIKAPRGDWDAWLANKTTPKAVGYALDRDNREFNKDDSTKPFIIMLPAISHDLLKKGKDGNEDNALEREADAMAEKVMQAPATGSYSSFFRPAPVSTSMISRKCAACEKEEQQVQRKATAATDTISGVAAVSQALQSAGEPIDAGTRSFMEQRFGYSFGQVRIHNNDIAHQSSTAINALAYTHGNDIVFAKGYYKPATNGGRQLLAHELTHVLQQNAGSLQPVVQRKTGDGHDLRSKRFSGNAVLEDVYDGNRLLQRGAAGQAVTLVQQSLLAQGYQLPQYGADGAFGNETYSAVRQFQADQSAALLDGIIGVSTMQLLDDADQKTPGGAPGKANTLNSSSFIVVESYGEHIPSTEIQGIADKDVLQKISDAYKKDGVCWNGNYLGIDVHFGTTPFYEDGSSPRTIAPALDIKMVFKEKGGFTSYRYKGADSSPVWYHSGKDRGAGWLSKMQTFFVYPLNKKGTLTIHIEMLDFEDDRLLVYEDAIDYIKCGVKEACTENATATNRWVIVPDNGGPIHPLGKSDPDDGEHYEIYKEDGKDNYFICMDDGTRVPVTRNGLPEDDQ